LYYGTTSVATFGALDCGCHVAGHWLGQSHRKGRRIGLNWAGEPNVARPTLKQARAG
jgi:hypothetical protein